MKNKGITLVALVITIIILLILAGITISSLTNTGIFKKAREAKEKTQQAEINQEKILDEYEKELNQYDEKTLVNKVNTGAIKIGDYISYTPDTSSIDDILQELKTYSGSEANTASTLTQEKLDWRVLDVENGQVRLISATPTKSQIALYGYNAYNNGVKLLDDVCNVLYNSKSVSKVQNLKIEDIQNKMKEKDYSKITSKYGSVFSPAGNYYPSILIKEKGQEVTDSDITTNGTKLDLSEQFEFQKQDSEIQADTWNLKYTIWEKEMNVDDFTESNYYKLFIRDNSENYPEYLLSSRCVYAYSDRAYFYIRRINTGKVSARNMYDSLGNSLEEVKYSFRPVITLNSDVQLDTEKSGDGSNADNAYVIK